MVLLLLTSALLLTIDLRGNALLDAGRTAFNGLMRPIEDAADVVSRPVRNAWRGATQYDDLEEENRRLQELVDAMRADNIVARSVIFQWLQLLAISDLESPASHDLVLASVIGQSPSNIDQVIEINKGRDDGLRVGMPVITPGGALIGKVTEPLLTDQASVMLITDSRYTVEARIVAPQPLPTTSTTTTTTTTTEPSAVPLDSVPDPTISTTTTTTTSTTTTTEAPTTTTTTTTLPPERETGAFSGRGPGELPEVRLIEDTPGFGNPDEGDTVLTSGGRQSLAPADIPIGTVTRVRRGSASEGLILEVQPLANLETLEFVEVVLYLGPTQAAAEDR